MLKQLRGHCQCCGRLQAVTRGTMAHHGYTVEGDSGWGHFVGACQGAAWAPIEHDRNIADSRVDHAKADARRLMQRSRDYRLGRMHPEACTDAGPWDPQARKYSAIPWFVASERVQERALARTADGLEANARGAASWAKQMAELIVLYHGKPLVEAERKVAADPVLVGEQRLGRDGRTWTVKRLDGRYLWATPATVKDAIGKTYRWSLREWRAKALVPAASRSNNVTSESSSPSVE